MVSTPERRLSLQGKTALVAGATRGAGRGIAVSLGERGATVFCSGRSVTGATTGRPETVQQTADLVTAAGGVGIAVQCDHLREEEVRALCARWGPFDVLVNDIWGGDALAEFGVPPWQMDVEKGWRMMETAVKTHLVTLRYALPGMVERGSGLVVEVTDGNAGFYRGALFYDLVKSTIVRLAFDLNEATKSKGVTALAVTPGFLRSEAMLDHFGVSEANWKDGAKKDPHFVESETPRFVGRGVAALASDPNVARKGGRVFASWDLAEEYGYEDVDGRKPDWGRYFERHFPGVAKPLDDGFYAYWGGADKLGF